MQIYCDESGGKDDGIFIVASVLVEEIAARRLVKSFRKKTGIVANEIKGKALSLTHRHFFLSLLPAHDIKAAAVICRRKDPVGGWALNTIPESEIWQNLVAESCALLQIDEATSLKVTPDRGRYSKYVTRQCEKRISRQIAQQCRINKVDVNCADSQSSPGIQIADVIANTRNLISMMLQNFENTPISRVDELFNSRLYELEQNNILKFKNIDLSDIRPDWLSPREVFDFL